MKSHGHSPLGSIKDRVDDVGFEHFSVLPHIQYNGTDKPNTFFDLIIGARSQMRGQRAMQGGLAGPRVELCVEKFRDVLGGTKSPRASWAYPQRLSLVGNG